MKIQRWIAHLVLTALTALAMAAVGHAQSKSNDIAIVVNSSTPVNELSLSEARKIFRGDRQYWTKDLPIVLLVRNPPSREREVILRTLYAMTESAFKQYWIAKIFRAEATTGPKVVYSDSMASDLVKVIPGAIACMSAKEVAPGLKMVKIDGHLPGEAGYPLR
jgi:hypothetical protein